MYGLPLFLFIVLSFHYDIQFQINDVFVVSLVSCYVMSSHGICHVV